MTGRPILRKYHSRMIWDAVCAPIPERPPTERELGEALIRALTHVPPVRESGGHE